MGQTADELRREVAARRFDISRDLDAIGDRVSPKQAIERRKSAARDRLHNMKDAVMGSADTASTTMGEAKDSAKGAVAEAGQHLAETPEVAKRQVQGNPLAAGLIAFGAGLLAASLLPPTRREQDMTRYAESGLQKAAGELRDTGQQIAVDLRDQAQDAVEQVREVAGDAASHVTEHTREAAGSVTEQARSSAGHVRDEVRQGPNEEPPFPIPPAPGTRAF